MGLGIVNLIMPTITGGIISACEGVMVGGLLGYCLLYTSTLAAIFTILALTIPDILMSFYTKEPEVIEDVYKRQGMERTAYR